MKYNLALYVGQVYWFAPGFSAKQLACQLWPMSGLSLLDVYEVSPSSDNTYKVFSWLSQLFLSFSFFLSLSLSLPMIKGTIFSKKRNKKDSSAVR